MLESCTGARFQTHLRPRGHVLSCFHPAFNLSTPSPHHPRSRIPALTPLPHDYRFVNFHNRGSPAVISFTAVVPRLPRDYRGWDYPVGIYVAPSTTRLT